MNESEMSSRQRFLGLLAATSLTVLTLAQAPPPGGPPQGGGAGPARNGMPTGRANQSSRPSNGQTSDLTATIQLLARTDVQKELALTSAQYNQLSQIAQALSKQSATEETARNAVAKVLSTAQTTRLTELLIQYLGYGSLTFADVRAKLTLTSEQQARIADILTQAAQSKKTIKSTAANADLASRATANLDRQANELLSKVLTSEQDKALRALAGKSL